MTEMTKIADEQLQSPLKAYKGERPPAPEWFDKALAHEPEREFVASDGARIEVLTWGERGQPGLLFLHGFGANADWWDFIAPRFADRYRVAAMSWSGMGRSDWRDVYTTDGFLHEALSVMEAAGLFDHADKPLVVGHSFGARLSSFLTQRHGERLRGVVLVDPPIFPPDKPRASSGPPGFGEGQAHRIYPDLVTALSRFRYAPLQTCAYPFITDHIARHSLKEVEGGYTWRFDASLFQKYTREDAEKAAREAKTPLALIYGTRSALYRPEDIAFLKGLMPQGAPFIAMDAAHHVMLDQPLAFVNELEAVFSSFA